jgi:hypothetical protein
MSSVSGVNNNNANTVLAGASQNSSSLLPGNATGPQSATPTSTAENSISLMLSENQITMDGILIHSLGSSQPASLENLAIDSENYNALNNSGLLQTDPKLLEDLLGSGSADPALESVLSNSAAINSSGQTSSPSPSNESTLLESFFQALQSNDENTSSAGSILDLLT